MPTLVELATQIVTAQTTVSALSTDEIVSALTRIHATLGQLDGVAATGFGKPSAAVGVTVGKALGKSPVVCMICGKSFKMLGAHLATIHGINTKEYRKRFSLPATPPVAVQGAAAVVTASARPSAPKPAAGMQRTAKPARALKMASVPKQASTPVMASVPKQAAAADSATPPRKAGRPRKNAQGA